MDERRGAVVGALRVTSVMVASAIALSACAGRANGGDDAESIALAEDGSDTTATENDSATLTTSLLAASALRVGPQAMGYTPAGCLTSTRDDTARTVTLTFADCTGPLGLAHLTGTVTIAWTAPTATSLHLDIAGNALRVNRATASFSATADITEEGAARTMAWSAKLDGTTARGRPFTRTTTKTVRWSSGQACFTVDGTSEGDVHGRDVRTTVEHFTRCRGECPEAGSTLEITNVATGRTVTFTYDGGPEATFTGPNGRETTIPLTCGLGT